LNTDAEMTMGAISRTTGTNLGPEARADPKAPLVLVRQITKRFGPVIAVDGVSLEVFRGEIVSLLGPSGSGKTTTLMMVAGHEMPDTGSIEVGGRNITSMPPHKRDIGMVFQHYALFPHMTVEENVGFPLRMRNVPRAVITEKVRSALELVKLQGLEERFPKQLIGGQGQRVALARALVFSPSILLMDEPLSALDKKLREEMQLEIKRIQNNLGITTLYVTHDQHEALLLSDRIAVFNKGRIAQVGAAQEIYDRPLTRFVADFLGEMSFLAGQLVDVTGTSCRIAIAPGLVITGQLASASGSSAMIAGIRPEAVFIGERAGHPEMNHVEGLVETIDHCGDAFRVKVKLPDGQYLLAKQNNTGLFKSFSAGDRVSLSWAWEKTTIIGQEGVDDGR
jgi:putative spermidine/putrescine transport system ATP-binding protein